MTLLMINREDLYHFETVQDAVLWMERNGDDNEIVIIEQDEYDEDFQLFLEEHYPLEIL